MKQLIYVVEDSEIIASIVKRVLETDPNNQVRLFSAVEPALEAIEAFPPDLIITDYYFDNHLDTLRNGAFLAREVRKMGVESVIFLLTGKTDLREDILEGNFNVILDKSDNEVIYNLDKKVRSYLNF